jgi:nicotinamidase-related amidase
MPAGTMVSGHDVVGCRPAWRAPTVGAASTLAIVGQNDLTNVPPERVGVLMVDFQNQFCHPKVCGPGPVTNGHNADTARRANTFANAAAQLGAQVVYTRQVFDPNRLTVRQRKWDEQLGLCEAGSWEAELFLDPVPGSVVITKPRFDVWQSSEFLKYLRTDPVDAFIIAGVELRCCVLFAALGADEQGYRFVVPQDLVSGLDAGDDSYNDAGRRLLKELYHAPETSRPLLDAWANGSA